MEQNNTNIINLPKGSYVTLQKDEYMELQALKNKDYDFEKRVSEIKLDYDEKYDTFLKSKTVSVHTSWSCFGGSETILKVDGLQKELLERLNKEFGIERVSDGYYGKEIWLKDGKLFVEKYKVKKEYEDELKDKEDDIEFKDGRIDTYERIIETNKDDLKKKDKEIRLLKKTINELEEKNERLRSKISFMNIIKDFFHIK